MSIENRITIVSAPRPEVDDAAAWVAVIRQGLRELQQLSFQRNDFVECDACASKPGSPSLCAGCLANRHVVGQLRAALKESCDLYEAAECVGPTRSERERIEHLRRLVT